MPTAPDRLHIDVGDRKLYGKLEEEDIFQDKTRKEQFLFAMAVGVKNDSKRALEQVEGSGFFLTKDLRPEDEALMNAVAIQDSGSVDVLSNRAEVFRIAEQYAHGGIRVLIAKIESTQFGSFAKHFELELCKMHEELTSSIN